MQTLGAILLLSFAFLSVFSLGYSTALSSGMVGIMLTYALQPTQEVDYVGMRSYRSVVLFSKADTPALW